MKAFEDIHRVSLNKAGEELCGDQVRILRSGPKTRLVLSDGLGSGVKANILACLTAEIITRMLEEGASLRDVVETIAGTLPVCKERNLAYSTFTVIELDHELMTFRVYNFDNPPILFFRNRKFFELPYHTETVLGREIQATEGQLEFGDFLALISDGIPHAGLGTTYNFGWGIENIADFIENIFKYHPSSAKTIVQMTSVQTLELYGGKPGDDATMVGVLIRPSRSAIVFTGPPLDMADDQKITERVLSFQGTRIVCGGTTGNIVADHSGQTIQTDISTLEEDIPPIGHLPNIDLLTEGILTMNRASELIEKVKGDPALLPHRNNGAVLLARALMDADEIDFLVGQKVNPFYQNPLLPTSVSIRNNLVQKIAAQLEALNKRVQIEYF